MPTELPKEKPVNKVSLPVVDEQADQRKPQLPVVALIGNPNAGKTTLFNRFSGLRAKTANFAGTTVDHRASRIKLPKGDIELLDLPGLYGLDSATPDEKVAQDVLLGRLPGMEKPDAVLLVLDATNLERNLYLAARVIELGLPTVVALNMWDIAQKQNNKINLDSLAKDLAVPVIPISARTGEGVEQLTQQLDISIEHYKPAVVPESLTACSSCGECPYAARFDWAEQVSDRAGASSEHHTHGPMTEAIDRILTHPVIGIGAFFAVMATVFIMIFWLAAYPMDWIEGGFGYAGELVGSVLDDGDFKSLIVDGIIGGVGGVLVFLPQILILFFFLTLLEDTGYMSRAAFVMDRLMRRVGLPGRAFVPMLSAHACAIPAIMATKIIEDRRDRLVTILVLPLMTCSARLPVYVMLIALLFAGNALYAGLAFTAAYSLGIIAALVMAFLFKKTILPGESKPLVIELPSYRRPSIKNALLLTLDRSKMFVKKAGTVILVLSILLWAASTYPKMPEGAESAQAKQRIAQLDQQILQTTNEANVADFTQQIEQIQAKEALAYSVAGRAGKVFEPVFRPLGFDWQINVGVLSSFAAREVIVSTLAIVYGVGEDVAEDGNSFAKVLDRQTREDGSKVFTTATSFSLLVFYVLAMQCLPTQAVTRREAGGWKWAIFQLGYMSALAYGLALITYQTVSFFT
ncbi:Ferrous iron transport protein B [Poriferisphaera corsica]|uniref:Ferrous iron transport protein B n=1 Tax=Poriferisphaera corsica TaxID=2528020 RepID=A0A517YV84_9BACT|nr:ferrous iron transport protein B [Poriferisphaera corsica]QDU34135.1 Ferrous iron transport protein B [Poriferisphaera corsica]